MACRRCASDNHKEFGAEINIHFRGRAGLDKPGVLVFPMLVVCLECGLAEFSVPESELRQLVLGTEEEKKA